MKRWRSRISVGLAGLSVLMCVAFLFLWARSLTRAELVAHTGVRIVPPRAAAATPSDGFADQWLAERCDWTLGSDRGTVKLVRSIAESYRQNEPELAFTRYGRGWRYDWYRPEGESKDAGTHFRSVFDWRVPGLGMYTYTGGGGTSYIVEVPMWLLAVLSAVPFVLVVMSRQRANKRRGLGLCVACGYDVKGIGAGVCPECGAGR